MLQPGTIEESQKPLPIFIIMFSKFNTTSWVCNDQLNELISGADLSWSNTKQSINIVTLMTCANFINFITLPC